MQATSNKASLPRRLSQSGGWTAFSPLMRRIMAVNVFAVVILVGGVLYLNDYRDRLIQARVDELVIQAEIIAGALGETTAGPEDTEIDLPTARQIIQRLVTPTRHRARLFAARGALLTDSRFLEGDFSIVEEALTEEAAPPSLMDRMEVWALELLDGFSQPLDAPENLDHLGVRASSFIEVEASLVGEVTHQIRRRSDGLYVINVAAPVQRFRRVLGSLLLTAQTEDIAAIIRAEKLLILKVSAGAILVTALMSFFLGLTLVRPIRVLARAAERVRRGIGREEHLPEFSERRDEIGDLSRSLSEMTRALYNQIDAVERFAADVAHELKNPITSLLSAVETLERSTDPEVQQKLIAILRDDVRRLERLITDVSEASRLDAELTRGDLEPLDLFPMMQSIVDGYHSVGLKRGIELELEASKAGLVSGIEQRLGQVWRNLIDNALSFSPEGGTVKVSLKTGRHTVRLAVEDEGPGLPQNAEKIFKRFYSERPDGEAFGVHSGLGLAISRQIIDAHGGRIVATDRVDDDGQILGARFEVTLPRRKES